MARNPLIHGALVAMILAGGGARAADSEADQLREQLRSTVLQLRQLQDQQAAPAQAPATPAADDTARKLAAANARLRAARRDAARAAGLQADLEKARADNAALAAAAGVDAAELERVKTAYAASEEAARALSAERDTVKARLATMTSVATACQVKNDRLAAFGESMLTAYRRLTLVQSLAAREPLLGLKRVEFENIAQDREDASRAARCDPGLGTAAQTLPSGR